MFGCDVTGVEVGGGGAPGNAGNPAAAAAARPGWKKGRNRRRSAAAAGMLPAGGLGNDDLISSGLLDDAVDPGEELIGSGVTGLVLPGDVAEAGLPDVVVIGGRPGCFRYPLISPFGSSIMVFYHSSTKQN
jgi:hypothetical protein